MYSFKKGLYKGLKSAVLFAMPVLIDKFIYVYPEYAQLTLGGLLVMVYNFVKVKFYSN